VKKQKLQYWILAADLFWIAIAALAAYVLRYGFAWYEPSGTSRLIFVLPLLATVGLWAMIFSWMKLDGFCRGWQPSAIFSQLFLGVCFLMTVLLVSGYLLRTFVSRLTFTYLGIVLFAGFVAIRYVIHAILGSRYLARAVRRVVIVGGGPVAQEMAAKLERHPEMLCQVVGFLCSADVSFDTRIPGTGGEPIIVQTLGVIDVLRDQRVDEIVIALPSVGLPEVMNLAARCRRDGIGVSVIPHPYELYLSKPQLLDIGGLPVLQLREANANFANAVWKRALDVALGSIFLVLSLPVVAIGAIVLLGKQGGPFSCEPRCGRFGATFRMWRLNSARECKQLSRREIVLQQLSITELPQLWNVLRGEMSLVGPRPESPERVKHYSDWQLQRLNAKPGMTGLAQVHGLREQHSSEEKTRFDLQYMLDSSPFLDFSLLLQTFGTLIGRLLRLYKLPLFKPIEDGADAASGTTIDLFEGTLPSAHSTQPSAD
jgi:lipopolysaccharide/colanic/teichoic acid biosynthesis glycosyltransferase